MLGFRNAALLLHTPHILCVFPPSCFLAAPALGRRLLPWRRFLLGDAFSWQRLLLATPYFLATPVAASNRKKIKTKNQGKVFLELLFSFIRVTSLKNPRKGKRVSPSTRSLHGCLQKSTKIKLQVGCIPATRNGTPSKVFRLYEPLPLASVILKGPVHLGDSLFSSSYG